MTAQRSAAPARPRHRFPKELRSLPGIIEVENAIRLEATASRFLCVILFLLHSPPGIIMDLEKRFGRGNTVVQWDNLLPLPKKHSFVVAPVVPRILIKWNNGSHLGVTCSLGLLVVVSFDSSEIKVLGRFEERRTGEVGKL